MARRRHKAKGGSYAARRYRELMYKPTLSATDKAEIRYFLSPHKGKPRAAFTAAQRAKMREWLKE